MRILMQRPKKTHLIIFQVFDKWSLPFDCCAFVIFFLSINSIWCNNVCIFEREKKELEMLCDNLFFSFFNWIKCITKQIGKWKKRSARQKRKRIDLKNYTMINRINISNPVEYLNSNCFVYLLYVYYMNNILWKWVFDARRIHNVISTSTIFCANTQNFDEISSIFFIFSNRQHVLLRERDTYYNWNDPCICRRKKYEEKKLKRSNKSILNKMFLIVMFIDCDT